MRQRIRMRFESTVPGAESNIRVRVRERMDTVWLARRGELLRIGKHSVRGKRGGSRFFEVSSFLETIPGPTTDWCLDFDLTTPDFENVDVHNAVLTHSGGETIPLRARGMFFMEEGTTRLYFASQGVDRGIRIQICKLRIDDTGAIVDGWLQFRAFGQRGVLRLPLP